MRTAAIFGPGASAGNLKPFRVSEVTWRTGMPETSSEADAIVIFGGDGTVHRHLPQPTYGGGMKIAPQAQLDDGSLDICVILNMSKLKLFCLFPTVYFGRHLSIPQVEYFQTESLRLETVKPLDVYADGEYVCRTPIEVKVARSALRVIVP